MSIPHEENGISQDVFLKIKNERIRECRIKADTKRLDHLQRIRDMRSKRGIHPLELFPKEIWEKILDELASPKDLGNALEVHDLFHEILENRHIRDVLFPQILNLKFIHFWKRQLDTEPEYRHRIRRKTQEKPLAEFAKLREVSKSLRNGIDHWYENEILKNLRNEKEAEIAAFVCTFPGNETEDSKLNGILSNYSGPKNSAKRFFLRSLKIKVHLPEYDGEPPDYPLRFTSFTSKTTKLLEIIGSQVWHFEWDISNLAELEAHGITLAQVYITFKEWTILMPNLKWLVINNGLYCDYLTESAISMNKTIFESHPFPCLEHLERICYLLNSDSYTSIFQVFSQVLSANLHVKALHVIPGIDESENEKFFRRHLNKLTNSLSLDLLEVFSVGTESSDSCKLEFIQPVVNLKWSLKRMQMGFDASTVTLKSIFSFLENFQSLEQLTLHLVDVKFEEDIPFLRLPNLTHLELDLNYDEMEFSSGANFFFSLQFLLHSKKLKKLVWNNQSYETPVAKLRRFIINQECSDRMINFRGGIRDMRSSNVWDLFPDLECVEVEIVKHDGSGITKWRRGERF